MFTHEIWKQAKNAKMTVIAPVAYIQSREDPTCFFSLIISIFRQISTRSCLANPGTQRSRHPSDACPSLGSQDDFPSVVGCIPSLPFPWLPPSLAGVVKLPGTPSGCLQRPSKAPVLAPAMVSPAYDYLRARGDAALARSFFLHQIIVFMTFGSCSELLNINKLHSFMIEH